MTRVVVATRSPDKLREIRQMLSAVEGLEVLDLDGAGVAELPEEAGVEIHDTFRDNALAKARYYARRAGALALADDSGLCVDALDGGPGVYSKRFSGRSDLGGIELDRANNALLLEKLQGLPPERRGAHYLCAIALVDPAAGREAVVTGRCDGVVLPQPRGEGGFGYDPLFFVPEEGLSFGELPPARKNEISHRARAVRAAAEVLADPSHEAWEEADASSLER
jgi:XTP/dITP diphosphohydrolase